MLDCAAKMGFLGQFLVALISLSQFSNIAAGEETKSSESCGFAAIFNFGDSNSDTGCMSAAFYPAALPYGQTFFHDAVGRASDGRLIIDFIGTHLSHSMNSSYMQVFMVSYVYAAKHLGLQYLSAYMDSIGTSYEHGANFGAASSTIRRQNRSFFDGGSPFSLEIQVAQFIQFKTRTAKLYSQGSSSFPLL